MKSITLIILLLLTTSNLYSEKGRIKDLVTIKGFRTNPIIGYGLIIGLNGTGDSGGEILNKSLKRMFKKLGLSAKKELNTKNVSAVIVTANLGAFSRIGQRIDVTISSIGDTTSLAGGNLLVTPLKGGDGNIYAIASGAISLGGLEKGNKFPTSGIIPNGAIVEKDLPLNLSDQKSLRLSLKTPDFTTSARIERIINEGLGGKYAQSKDAATIDLIIPTQYKRKIVQLIAIIESFEIIPDISAKIVINERTGTIIAGGNISLGPVAISHGNLTIDIGGSSGKDSQKNHIKFIENRTKIGDIIKVLNSMGATPEDLISIFQALKRNGSLIGDIELI
jgi:flagellar P-ring protein precursor FlgI